MSVALALVAVVALGTFGLVLILARRLRAVTERVYMFLPASPGSLPHPGTPVPEFDVASVDGERLNQDAFAGVDRIFAVLSTGCGGCDKQIAAFREVGISFDPPPIVAIVGAPQERAAMAAQLEGHAVLIEERDTERVVEAFEISEFPAVLLVRSGYIQQAGYELPSIAASLAALVASPSAGSPGQS